MILRALLLLFLLAPCSLSAQAPSRQRPAPNKVQVLEAMTIEGRIQKPQVFYLLSRHKFRYSGMDLKRSFLEQIVRSVARNPF